MSHMSISIPFFTQLVRRLRYANARYDQIARQCRGAQYPTYHAKRRAHRAGLRIDTSKAHAGFAGAYVSSTADTLPLLSARDCDPAWIPNTEECILDAGVGQTRNSGLALHRGAVETESVMACLSPLELSLNWNVGDKAISDPPVPGAPRWKSRPLPNIELSCTDHLACQGPIYAAPMQADLDPGTTGHLKRKQRDFEVDVFSRKPKMSVLQVDEDQCW